MIRITFLLFCIIVSGLKALYNTLIDPNELKNLDEKKGLQEIKKESIK